MIAMVEDSKLTLLHYKIIMQISKQLVDFRLKMSVRLKNLLLDLWPAVLRVDQETIDIETQIIATHVKRASGLIKT